MFFTHTRTILLALLAGFILPFSIQAQDVPEPAPITTEIVQQMRVDYEGVQFAFDAALADSVSVASYPASEGDAQFPSPAYTEFTLDGYAGGDYLNHAPMPRIDVFTIEDFGPYPYFIEQLDELSRLLAERPDLRQTVIADADNWGAAALPFLPIIPAAQVFRARPEYINVAGIDGIRYLAYYSQGLNPIVEGEVFYTFQGITDDGQHYVSIMLPVNTGVLPAELPDSVDMDAFAAEYQEYLMNFVGLLTTADPDNFSPALSTLDTLAQSVQVSR